MKRRILALAAALVLLAGQTPTAEAERTLRFSPGEEVPLAATVRQLGAREVTYEADTGLFTAVGKGMTFRTRAGEEWIEMNNVCWVLEAPVREEDGTLYVPIEPLCTAFGAGTETEGDTLLVRPGAYPVPDWPDYYGFSDVYWLSRLVYAESQTESFRTQVAVAEVVLNRLHSGMYPDTVEGVIFDRENGVQFSPTAEGTIRNTPTLSCLAAARAALSGSQTIPDDVLFFVLAGLEDDWVTMNRSFSLQLGVTAFYT